MMNTAMFSGAVFTAVLVLLVAIPWMFKQMTIYALHTLRDAVYSLGEAHPELRDSRLYQDVLFIHSFSIHAARDKGAWFCMTLLAARGGAVSSKDTAQLAAIYREEREQRYSGAVKGAAYDRLTAGVAMSRALVFLRVATAHPLMTAVTMVAAAWTGLEWLFKLATASSGVTEARTPTGNAAKTTLETQKYAHLAAA